VGQNTQGQMRSGRLSADPEIGGSVNGIFDKSDGYIRLGRGQLHNCKAPFCANEIHPVVGKLLLKSS
jgi:hypothetical protein